MKLNLGCGDDIREGFSNVDITKFKGVDLIVDLDIKEYPFKNNSVDYILAKDVLEHLQNTDLFLNECFRILKDDGELLIKVPHFSCHLAYNDYTHKRFFGYYSMDRVNGFKARKRIVFGKKYNLLNYLIEPIMNKIPMIYESTILKNIFPALRMEFKLEKIKGM